MQPTTIVQIIPSYEWVTVSQLNLVSLQKVFLYCQISCPIAQSTLKIFLQDFKLYEDARAKIREFAANQQNIDLQEEQYCYIGFECMIVESINDFIIINQFENQLIADQIYSINGDVDQLKGISVVGVNIAFCLAVTDFSPQLFMDAYQLTSKALKERNLNRVKYLN